MKRKKIIERSEFEPIKPGLERPGFASYLKMKQSSKACRDWTYWRTNKELYAMLREDFENQKAIAELKRRNLPLPVPLTDTESKLMLKYSK